MSENTRGETFPEVRSTSEKKLSFERHRAFVETESVQSIESAAEKKKGESWHVVIERIKDIRDRLIAAKESFVTIGFDQSRTDVDVQTLGALLEKSQHLFEKAITVLRQVTTAFEKGKDQHLADWKTYLDSEYTRLTDEAYVQSLVTMLEQTVGRANEFFSRWVPSEQQKIFFGSIDLSNKTAREQHRNQAKRFVVTNPQVNTVYLEFVAAIEAVEEAKGDIKRLQGYLSQGSFFPSKDVLERKKKLTDELKVLDTTNTAVQPLIRFGLAAELLRRTSQGNTHGSKNLSRWVSAQFHIGMAKAGREYLAISGPTGIHPITDSIEEVLEKSLRISGTHGDPKKIVRNISSPSKHGKKGSKKPRK